MSKSTFQGELQRAIRNNNIEKVDKLLKKNKEKVLEHQRLQVYISRNSKEVYVNARCVNVLQYAVLYSNDDIVRFILESGGNANKTDSINQTALHLACGNAKRLEKVKLLLAFGANIHAQDNEGNTPLHISCFSGLDEIVAFLLKKGADKSTPNQNGESAHDYVKRKSHLRFNILSLFESQGKHLNLPKCTHSLSDKLKVVPPKVQRKQSAAADTKSEPNQSPMVEKRDGSTEKSQDDSEGCTQLQLKGMVLDLQQKQKESEKQMVNLQFTCEAKDVLIEKMKLELWRINHASNTVIDCGFEENNSELQNILKSNTDRILQLENELGDVTNQLNSSMDTQKGEMNKRAYLKRDEHDTRIHNLETKIAQCIERNLENDQTFRGLLIQLRCIREDVHSVKASQSWHFYINDRIDQLHESIWRQQEAVNGLLRYITDNEEQNRNHDTELKCYAKSEAKECNSQEIIKKDQVSIGVLDRVEYQLSSLENQFGHICASENVSSHNDNLRLETKKRNTECKGRITNQKFESNGRATHVAHNSEHRQNTMDGFSYPLQKNLLPPSLTGPSTPGDDYFGLDEKTYLKVPITFEHHQVAASMSLHNRPLSDNQCHHENGMQRRIDDVLDFLSSNSSAESDEASSNAKSSLRDAVTMKHSDYSFEHLERQGIVNRYPLAPLGYEIQHGVASMTSSL